MKLSAPEPMRPPRRHGLGIDLGTTNTVAAFDGIPVPLARESGRTTLPSAVSFLPNGETRVGTTAKRRRSVDPKNTLFSAKRLIGRRWEDPAVQDFVERYRFDLVDQGDAGPAFATRCGPISAIDVAAIVLTHLASQLTHDCSDPQGTVISVPSQ